ncbi:MAG: hypothetical protein H7335_01115 [Massilia sp.]|nr:hypothetical protein [Massilia sp.]
MHESVKISRLDQYIVSDNTSVVKTAEGQPMIFIAPSFSADSHQIGHRQRPILVDQFDGASQGRRRAVRQQAPLNRLHALWLVDFERHDAVKDTVAVMPPKLPLKTGGHQKTS